MDTFGQDFYQIIDEDQEECRREHSALWDAMSQQYFLAFLSIDCDSCSAVVEVGSDPTQHVASDSTPLQLHEETISPDFVEGFLQIDPGSEDNLLFLERIFNFLGEIGDLVLCAVELSEACLFRNQDVFSLEIPKQALVYNPL